MALFRCASGGGGGGQITVTYDSDFYGQTITCTRGQKVYSKVASSSGSVVFVVNEEGDWLIECTIGQDTYSTTASIEFTTSTELVSIPDGSTVTPTDDVETWLACAGINDKAYTTLSEVLADSETFNALLGDSNACAYMARCEGWAVPALVPTMTSNTTPKGEASALDNTSGHEAYKAFDGTSNYYEEASGTGDKYIQYEFDTASIVTKVEISSPTGVSTFKQRVGDISIIAISDGVETVLSTVSATDISAFPYAIDISTPMSADACRVKFTKTASNTVGFDSIQFYSADVTLTDNQYAMSMIGQYDVCCDALLGNATWASAIVASAYADYVLTYEHGLVPVMTSATTPSGIVSSSTSNTGYEAYKVFDNDSSTRWLASSTSSNYVQYEFDTPVKVLVCKWVSELTRVTSYQLSASNDGTNFTPLINATTTSSTSGVFIVSTSTEYKYYRFIVSTTVASYNTGLISLQFFGGGKDLTNTEKIHGANNESAYYLDGATETPIVDPSTLSAGTYTFGSTVAKNPSDLTADYTKTIRITPNTKEIVLRPDKTLTWWGYNGGLESCTTANGWSHATWALEGGVFNTYDVSTKTPTANNTVNAVGTSHKIASFTTLHVIGLATGNNGASMRMSSKNFSTGGITDEYIVYDTTLSHKTLTPSSQTTDVYFDIHCSNSTTRYTATLYAMWYE